MQLSPIPLLEKFTSHAVDSHDGRTITNIIDDYASRKVVFDWFHTGKLSMTVGDMCELIGGLGIKPPRTGHLGNWQEIAAGRACALDHNGTVCGKKLGFPLITDFNQTENSAMDSGDTVYLPGSIVNQEKREELKIFTWNGNQIVERSRNGSYFVPFVFTPIEGTLMPLTLIQRNNCRDIRETKFISSLVVENKDIFKEAMRRIIDCILTEKNCPIRLSDLVDRVVFTDGSLSKVELSYSGGCFKINNESYKNFDSLFDAILLPFQIAHDPRCLTEHIQDIPQFMPFLSLPFSCVLDYVFNNYVPQCSWSAGKGTDLFNVYFEWGAFGSAGYPPRSKGYYKQKVRLIKNIYRLVTRAIPEIKPLLYILLPSTIFNLLPNSAYSSDIYCITELFEKVSGEMATLKKGVDSELVMKKIEQTVKQWFEQSKNHLSQYYVGRFAKNRCVYHQTQYHEHGQFVDIPQFDKLTLQHACMILGALHELTPQESI